MGEAVLDTAFLDALRGGAVLAPMAGVTDMPFRRLCLECGAVYAVTEMVSAKGYLMSGERLRAQQELLAVHPDEYGHVALQLFGHEPDVMAEAAHLLSADGRYFMIDLNFGCPVPKVCRNGEGSAMMRTPGHAFEVIRAVVAGSRIPVSVKMRLGYDSAEEYLELAHAAERAGAGLLTLHARTRSQYYAGQADWKCIRRLKSETGLPVIGNGDITDGVTARRMFQETGCDGIAVGRAAEGNPFIFDEIRTVLAGKTWHAPGTEMRRQMLLRHAADLVSFKGETIGVREMRRHVMNYVKGCRGAVALRRDINTITDLKALEAAVNRFFDGLHTESEE
ncbi:MAG: tRNA dihydrouridine synthase DusB [Clostridia bacterium]|nr:tRNA dihydrouridine synthase DusB [Clostridia bacterium]